MLLAIYMIVVEFMHIFPVMRLIYSFYITSIAIFITKRSILTTTIVLPSKISI